MNSVGLKGRIKVGRALLATGMLDTSGTRQEKVSTLAKLLIPGDDSRIGGSG